MIRILTEAELTLLAARHVDPAAWYAQVSERITEDQLNEQFAAATKAKAEPGHKPRAEQEAGRLALIAAEDAVYKTASGVAAAAVVESAGGAVAPWQQPLLAREAATAGHIAGEAARKAWKAANG